MKKLCLLFCISSLCYSNSHFCQKNQINKNTQYDALKEKINNLLKKYSNIPLLAKEADGMLSHLLKAKSPVISNWIKKSRLDPVKQENEIVYKWRNYYLLNVIVGKYPKNDLSINNLVEELFDKVNELSFKDKKLTLIKSTFEIAKKDLLKYIKNIKTDQKNKLRITKKIEDIDLYVFDKLKVSKYEKYPMEFINWGIAYDPVNNEINLGVDSLKYNAPENLYTVLVHEMAHSIDPCRWSAFFKGNNPFEKVIKCLRTEKSVGAKLRNDYLLDKMVEMKKISAKLAKSLKENPTCNKTFYPPRGVQKDQITEAFADWLSAEVVSINKKFLNSNMRQDLCEQKQLSLGSSYLNNDTRIEALYLANPIISKTLGIKSKYKYCKL